MTLADEFQGKLDEADAGDAALTKEVRHYRVRGQRKGPLTRCGQPVGPNEALVGLHYLVTCPGCRAYLDGKDIAENTPPATEPPKRKRGRPRKTASGNPVLDGIIEGAERAKAKAKATSTGSSPARVLTSKTRAFGLGAGPSKKSAKKKASGSAKKKSGASAKAAKAEPVKSAAQRAREVKLDVLSKLEREFNAHNIQEFLSGVLRGVGRWDNKLGRYVEPEGRSYEVTTAEARELGELLGLELQIEARRRQFLARARREIQGAEGAESNGAEGGAR